MSLSIYYQNVRGLRTKTDDFYHSSLQSDFDVICITETWLNNTVNSSELFSDNYNVYRSNRSFQATFKKDGGGVAIGVRTSLLSSQISVLTNSSVFELIGVYVRLKSGKRLIVCCVYFPPFGSSDNMLMLMNKISAYVERNSPS